MNWTEDNTLETENGKYEIRSHSVSISTLEEMTKGGEKKYVTRDAVTHALYFRDKLLGTAASVEHGKRSLEEHARTNHERKPKGRGRGAWVSAKKPPTQQEANKEGMVLCGRRIDKKGGVYAIPIEWNMIAHCDPESFWTYYPDFPPLTEEEDGIDDSNLNAHKKVKGEQGPGAEGAVKEKKSDTGMVWEANDFF